MASHTLLRSCEQGGAKLTLETVPVVGCWDRLRIEQVVTNLLTNAALYGEGRPVRVSVAGDATQARLVVEDRGPGIALEDQGRLFEQFVRGDNAHGKGGLGLGLYISRRIVEAHGGRIVLCSALGWARTMRMFTWEPLRCGRAGASRGFGSGR